MSIPYCEFMAFMETARRLGFKKIDINAEIVFPEESVTKEEFKSGELSDALMFTLHHM